MGATVFELNGAFMALLGWPIAATTSWAGWLFGCAILVVRGNHRRRSTVQFAIVLALAIYAGQPDTLVLLAISLAVFLVVLLGFRAGRMGWSDGTLRPGLDLGIGAVAGLGLAAPLAFPAAQLSSGSVRAAGRHNAYPIHDVLHVIFQKFNGWPLGRSKYFDVHGVQYVPTAAYVGVIALVLAVVALCVLRRRPAVIGFGCVGAVMAALVFVSPLVSLLNGLPGFGEIRWVRAIQLVAFALSVLAGAGLNEVVRSHGGRQVRNWMGAGFGSIGVLLIVIWLFGRGNLPRFEASIRARSFIWPAVEVAVGLLVFLYLVAMGRRVHADTGRCRLLTDPGWTAGGVLLLVSTGWLVAIGTPWWPSSNSFLVPTPNVTSLQRAVGNSVVGFGPASCYYTPALGIPPNVNLVYRVHELDYYDPLIPDSLYKSWIRFTGQSPTAVGPLADVSPISMFCPVITTAAQARLFGVTYVLEQRLRKSGPVGSVYVTSIGGERLYRIPDASVATLTRLGAGGRLPSLEATGKPLRVTYPSPNSWKVVTHSATSQVLRLRLTDVPGWHASIDGKPLPLMPFAGAMLQARVPAGTHTIELHYWPDAFNVGIAVAAFSAIGLLLLITVGTRIRHRRPGHAEA
jgi:hypothetical protein